MTSFCPPCAATSAPTLAACSACHPVVRLPPDAPAVDFSTAEGAAAAAGLTYSVGKWDELRPNMYTTALFDATDHSIDGYAGLRNIHMGVDLGAPVGAEVYAYDDGFVHACGYNAAAGDYGHVIVTEHAAPPGGELGGAPRVWALAGHLAKASTALPAWQPPDGGGKRAVARGELIGYIGDVHENGGWPIPHVHFQLSVKEPATHDMPGVVSAEQRDDARRDYPDPRLVLGPLY